MKSSIKFVATYRDSNGNAHTELQTYSNISGLVTMMKDFKFEGMDYSKSSIATEAYNRDCKRFIVLKSKFGNKHEIYDSLDDTLVATFFSKAEAYEYAKYKNDVAKYDEDIDLIQSK